MSVTFQVEPIHTGRIHVEGYDWAGENSDPVILATFADYEAYEAYIASVGREFAWAGYDWSSYLEDITSDSHKVNMANDNARVVMTALGLDTDELWGNEDASTFRERVLIAMATYAGGDEQPACTEITEGGAIWHYGGRSADYVPEKLVGLLKVAEEAQTLGLQVCWG